MIIAKYLLLIVIHTMPIRYITDQQVLEKIETSHDYWERDKYIKSIKSSIKGTIIGLYIMEETDAYNIILQYADTLKLFICDGCDLTEIPKIEHLTYLDCARNKITKLGDYPNLTTLNCYNNQITELEIYPNLTKLYCSDNQITKLGVYPNLTILNCRNNQITKLGDYPNLTYLNCHGNKITELGDYPNLTTLICYNNLITELGDYQHLTELECYNNQITKLEDYPNLTYLECYNNPINPIYITRLNRIMLKNKNNIYNDGQNVHDHNIQESLKKSIKYLIDNYGGKELVFEIPEELDGINYHSELMLTEKEIFELVLKRINEFDDETKKELEKILYDELENGRCKCFTGRVTRIVNTLVGFDENITIGISDNEQIMNIYDVLLKQGKLSKETFREALTERGYSEDIIVTWVDAIDE